jgi:hypothetical protein
MRKIDVTDEQFARLQAFATPLIDSVETVFSKVLDLAESTMRSGSPLPTAWRPKLEAVADLSHTTLKSASIDGKHLPSSICNWNGLLIEMVRQAAKRLPPDTEISDLIVVNHVTGRKIENGYKFLPSENISIQGQNSNNAWKAILHLAKETGLKVDAHFYWANHSNSARPGEMGRLQA